MDLTRGNQTRASTMLASTAGTLRKLLKQYTDELSKFSERSK